MAGGGARLDVVVDAQGPDASIEFLVFLRGRFSLGLDLCFALAVGSFGFFEDVDQMLALEGGQQGLIAHSGLIDRLTLLTTLPDLLMTVMVSPTPMTVVV